MERIRDSIGGKPEGNSGKPEGNHSGISEPWTFVIAAKDEMIRTLQEENAHLRDEVARLLPLALPAPRQPRGSLWTRILNLAPAAE